MTAGTVEASWREWRWRGNADVVDADQEPRDEAWCAQLYEDTFDIVYHFARTLVREHATAEDIVAETYLKVWRARSKYSGKGSALAWVMAITRNCAMDHLRSRKPNVSLDIFDALGDPEGEAPGGSGFSEADGEVIRQAIMKLKPEQQQVVFMRFYEEVPHEVIATRLGKSTTAIRQIQLRALGSLRRYLKDQIELETGKREMVALSGGALDGRSRRVLTSYRVRRSRKPALVEGGAE